MNLHDILQAYSPSMTFSTVILSIAYNFYLIMKLKYGDLLINKTTLMPYYLALFYLCSSAVCYIII